MKINANYQDQVFGAARPSIKPRSILNRANLNIYSNTSRRMQVVMNAAAALSEMELENNTSVQTS